MNLKAAVGGGVKFSGSHMTASNGKIYLAFQAEVTPGMDRDRRLRPYRPPTRKLFEDRGTHQAPISDARGASASRAMTPG